MYLRFLEGGPSGDWRVERELFKDDLGWVLDDLLEMECLDIGAIVRFQLHAIRMMIVALALENANRTRQVAFRGQRGGKDNVVAGG